WERFETSPRRLSMGTVTHRRPPPPASAPPAEGAIDDNSESNGCHTDGGLSVADPIAKVGGPTTYRASHHHAAPALAPDPTPPEPGDRYELVDPFDIYAAPAPSVYLAQLPDLELSHPQRPPLGHPAAEEMTVLPKIPGRSPPPPIVEAHADG